MRKRRAVEPPASVSELVGMDDPAEVLALLDRLERLDERADRRFYLLINVGLFFGLVGFAGGVLNLWNYAADPHARHAAIILVVGIVATPVCAWRLWLNVINRRIYARSTASIHAIRARIRAAALEQKDSEPD